MSETPLVAGITGGTGSGKTTLANELVNAFSKEGALCIQQDAYYKDRSAFSLKERERINYDCPSAFDDRLLISHLTQLTSGKSVRKPIYDFETHTRKKEGQVVYPHKIIVVEGILILLQEKLRDLMNVKIFLDIDADIRLSRRILRDTRERSRSTESVIAQWFRTVKPMHEKYIAPAKKYADIVYNTDPSEEDLRILLGKIKGA